MVLLLVLVAYFLAHDSMLDLWALDSTACIGSGCVKLDVGIVRSGCLVTYVTYLHLVASMNLTILTTAVKRSSTGHNP